MGGCEEVCDDDFICWVPPARNGNEDAIAAMYSSEVNAAFKSVLFSDGNPAAAWANAAAAAIVVGSLMAAFKLEEGADDDADDELTPSRAEDKPLMDEAEPPVGVVALFKPKRSTGFWYKSAAYGLSAAMDDVPAPPSRAACCNKSNCCSMLFMDDVPAFPSVAANDEFDDEPPPASAALVEFAVVPPVAAVVSPVRNWLRAAALV